MGLTILIVDDSRLARMSVIRTLTRLRPDFTYVEAREADEALALAQSEQIHAAVIDFNMPGRDGLALAAELVERFEGLPIAILSANAQDDVVAAARKLGAIFLSKPLEEAAFEIFLADASSRAGG